MIVKTGVNKGRPIGGRKERELNLSRELELSISAQYQAADIIAYNGYKIENNPTILPEDIKSGIKQNAEPDFRIEGLIFDCYTPSQGYLSEEYASLRAFREWASENPCGEMACIDEDWIDDIGGFDSIKQKTKERILDIIVKNIKKIHEKQAFNVVVNIVDVSEFVSKNDLSELTLKLNNGRITRLQHVLIVIPGEPDEVIEI